MRPHLSSRLCLGAACAVLLSAAPAFGRLRGPQPASPPATLKPNRAPVRPNPKPVQNQEHLQQWMERHRALTLPNQLHELEKEPGFHDLPAINQQRMRDRIIQLNNMTPQQRDRILERNEVLEKMSAPQRQQYRSAVQSFAALPADHRRLMARAIVDLRQMPSEQRQNVVNSEPFRSQFPEDERSIIRTLLEGEPDPAPRVSEGP